MCDFKPLTTTVQRTYGLEGVSTFLDGSEPEIASLEEGHVLVLVGGCELQVIECANGPISRSWGLDMSEADEALPASYLKKHARRIATVVMERGWKPLDEVLRECGLVPLKD